LVLIGNGRYYGGQFILFPRAALDDGLLDVCTFPRVNWWTLARCAGGLITQHVYRHGGARHFQATHVRITAATRVPLEVEGETIGELPATFALQPGAVRVVVP
jgi:diacylglycerol kinase family enzyme